MAQWEAFSRVVRPTQGKAVVALGLVVLVMGLGQAECPIDGILGVATRILLRALPSVALAAWQALHGHGCEHAGLWQAFLQVSGCGWPVLLNLAGAV